MNVVLKDVLNGFLELREWVAMNIVLKDVLNGCQASQEGSR